MVKYKCYPITVKCPVCSRRILDKVSDAHGIIELKCPQCGKFVKVDLSIGEDGVLKYRIVRD